MGCSPFSVPPRRARRLALSLATSAFNPRRTSVVFSLTPVNSAAFSSNPSSMFNVVFICMNMYLLYVNVNEFSSWKEPAFEVELMHADLLFFGYRTSLRSVPRDTERKRDRCGNTRALWTSFSSYLKKKPRQRSGCLAGVRKEFSFGITLPARDERSEFPCMTLLWTNRTASRLFCRAMHVSQSTQDVAVQWVGQVTRPERPHMSPITLSDAGRETR